MPPCFLYFSLSLLYVVLFYSISLFCGFERERPKSVGKSENYRGIPMWKLQTVVVQVVKMRFDQLLFVNAHARFARPVTGRGRVTAAPTHTVANLSRVVYQCGSLLTSSD